jgi:hypothetical protein
MVNVYLRVIKVFRRVQWNTTSYRYNSLGQLTPKAKIKPKAKLKVGCGAAVYTELGAKYMSPTINIAPVIRFNWVLWVLPL